MQLFPSREIILQIGDTIAIRWYAVCIMFGALLAFLGFSKEGKKAGYDSEVFDDLFIGCLFFGIVGARLWYCLFYDFSGYFSNPLSIIEIWDGGLAIQGGLILGAAFGLFYCKVKNYSFIHLADIVFPYILIAQALGRWGNYANQEAFGNVVDESYFNGILGFLKEGMFINGSYRQPMFFYESMLCLIGFILIKLYRKYTKTYRGSGVFGYLAWYGAIRFWIESQRSDSLMFHNIKTAQVVSIVFLLVGMVGLLGGFKKIISREKPVIIFDLDGTLLDTGKVIAESFAHVFKKYIPDYVITEQDRVNFLGPTLEETFNKYIPDGNVDEMIEMYRVHNQAHQKDMVKAFDHVKELLDYLKANNYRYAIASSKVTDTILLGLQTTNLQDYFDTIVGVEQIDHPKPNKETIVKAYEALGGRLDNCIYVGDSDTDVLAAKNAGVYSIAFCSNKLKQKQLEDTKPNKLIFDMGEIEDILKEDHLWTSNLM